MSGSETASATGHAGRGASLVVAALASAFGVLLLETTSVLATVVSGNDVSRIAAVRAALSIVAFLFITIAVYVSAIVTTNTVATVIAGRTRTIALMHLIGSSAGDQRRAVALDGLKVGLAGAVLGAAAGILLSFAGVRLAFGAGLIPDLGYRLLEPLLALPVVIVVLSTWCAAWVGSRRVLTVSPMQAVGAAQERTLEESARRPGRNAFAIVLMATGVLFLAGGVWAGQVTEYGVLLGLAGGLLSFTGLVLGSHLIMPPMLSLVGRFLGGSAPARLAVANASQHPERSARTTIGLVIGVTLITMFAVAGSTFETMMQPLMDDPVTRAAVSETVSTSLAVISVLVGFSALIAAVGMINNLALSVLQRSREIGLLRALGFTGRQVRAMILAESVQMTVAAVTLGLVLGVAYGWAAAQSLFGSVTHAGLVAPSIPWLLVTLCVVGTAVLTVGATILPARRAVSLAPIAALAAG
ncbi:MULTISPECIES: ABC transporter permease [unclassified Cryobacterium]|uniref:ABC transporter permease n=1 Tax=unclassified Cryobacterium TaxID=2649013 RepID=UPI002AB41183|nr:MULTISPECIES: ABC transporter permease [unclassified Cryobacterium]MDY7527612.1 ABC transporter permease [Cryobacterium sp. 10C2]MDY7556608.1 ABC transporter permease [Cryobacterium sp. 10C3]MEB0002777.1 ABC transporter permease [Cryobacterium sp. RTC2.1]MEB0200595.1 ABC transporter permease [Cryobacterium sp. 5I3]MEB0286941.1 ABC transporter permease [Cryobacterium sp. 10S3]